MAARIHEDEEETSHLGEDEQVFHIDASFINADEILRDNDIEDERVRDDKMPEYVPNDLDNYKDEAVYTDNNDEVETDEEHVATLDYELQLIRKIRLAFVSSLRMLEAAREDLVEVGNRMDRLTLASQACRQAFQDKRRREQQAAEASSK